MNLRKLFWPFSREKVYCNDCESWKKGNFANCGHENNLGDYMSKKSQKDRAWNINKNNDCKWFEKMKRD